MSMYSELHQARIAAVLGALRGDGGLASVMDLGCGSGTLIERLLEDPAYQQVLGMDHSGLAVEQIRRLPRAEAALQSARLRLKVGSYREFDAELAGYDAATMVETIEHLDPRHLSQAEETVFVRYQPRRVVVTTPNVEFNPLYGLRPGELRDPDHRFEWSRARFQQWARGVASRTGYAVRFQAVGELDQQLGAPTQMAVFTLK